MHACVAAETLQTEEINESVIILNIQNISNIPNAPITDTYMGNTEITYYYYYYFLKHFI